MIINLFLSIILNLISEYFINKGYIVDTQIPWTYHGRPDFGLYKHRLSNILNKYHFNNGISIAELSALRFFNKKKLKEKRSCPIKYKFIVGEVKTSQHKSQILNYLKNGIANAGFEFIPTKKNVEKYSGLINLDSNNKINIKNNIENIFFDIEKQKNDIIWFNKYLKINLLGNFSNQELLSFVSKYLKKDSLTLKSLIELSEVISFNDIFKKL